MLQVELRFSILNLSRTYDLGIMQPLPVIENRSTASNSMGSASTPITTVTPSGTYFTRSQFKFNSFGTPYIFLNVPLHDAITFLEFGKRGTGFTFGSGYGIRGGPEVDQFMRASSPDVIFNNGLTLSVTYASSWQLSFPETFPSPDKEFGVGEFRAATWSLKFNQILPEYLVTVTLVWSISNELKLHDIANFVSGIMIGLGSGIVAEGTRRGQSDNNHATVHGTEVKRRK
jgi:hypothetical protein